MRAGGAALVLLTALVAGSAPSAPAQRESSRERGPFLLVGLPSLGTVGWRCDGHTNRYALSFHAFLDSATDGVAFEAGSVSKRATIQPGESIRFPYVRSHTQRFTVVQGSEPRTLHARVTVYFAPGYTYCFSYLVPRVDVRIVPHFHY